MKKRVVAALMIMVMAASLMSGCKGKTKEVSDTVKWINATYSVLTAANNGSYDEIGGFKKSAVNKVLVEQLLDEWWDVTDRETADETVDWLLEEGHRTQFMADMTQLEENEITSLSAEEIKQAALAAGYEEDGAACLAAMVGIYNEKGEHAIDAWDYCRALQLLGYYYVAEYYTEEEALDKSLEIAKELQNSYGSWEELMESYLAGYQYWQDDDAEDAESATAVRRAVYEKIKDGDDSPFKLDWNTALEKTW